MLSNCGAGEDSSESLGLQKRSNQSILNEINPEYLLGGLMLKLKLQYFDHLTLGKTLTNSTGGHLLLNLFILHLVVILFNIHTFGGKNNFIPFSSNEN